MFNRLPSPKDLKIDEAIDELLTEMKNEEGHTVRYDSLSTQLTKLVKLREDSQKAHVSPDTLVLVIGNLLGIAIIVGHERANVVTSKALSFVMKAR